MLSTAVAFFVHASPAAADRGLLLGVTDDAPRWGHVHQTEQALSALGLGAIRYTERWQPRRSRIAPSDAASLAQAIEAAHGRRVVLSVYGRAGAAPHDAAGRDRYCSFVASILRRFPQLHDVVIWNEANSSWFWRPQFTADGAPAAPAAYEQLLAACYGPLHAIRPGLNIVSSLAPRGKDDPRASAGSISPVAFIAAMGSAYRSSGRSVRIFDSFGQNVYPRSPDERPGVFHQDGSDISEGDYPRLLAALQDAFAATGQPLPGVAGVSVWYLEDGFQTFVPRAKRRSYGGVENVRTLLPAPDQSSQLRDAIELAYCQPGVGAFFNFMLADETQLAGWQSGVLYADWTPKPSFAALAQTVREVSAGRVDCGGDRPPSAPPAPEPQSSPPPASTTAALSLAAVPLAAQTSVGATISYQFTIRNASPLWLSVDFHDGIPNSLTPVAVIAAGHRCDVGAVIACPVGRLPPNGSTTASVVAQVSKAGTIVNAPTLATSDPRASVDASAATTSITAVAPAPPVSVPLPDAKNARDDRRDTGPSGKGHGSGRGK